MALPPRCSNGDDVAFVLERLDLDLACNFNDALGWQAESIDHLDAIAVEEGEHAKTPVGEDRASRPRHDKVTGCKVDRLVQID